MFKFFSSAFYSNIPIANYRLLFVYHSRAFLELAGSLLEWSVWNASLRYRNPHSTELFAALRTQVSNSSFYFTLRPSIANLKRIMSLFSMLEVEIYDMFLGLELSVEGIKKIMIVFLECVHPVIVTTASMLKVSFSKPFINTFEDQKVSKAASYFLERTFKEPFVIDDILKILLHCIKNDQFVDEAKILGKIIVQDAANDKVIEEELTQFFVRIFQSNDIKNSAVNLVKFVFEQEDTKEILVQLFVNAFKDERVLDALKVGLTIAISEIVTDPELQKKVSNFVLVILEPLLKAERSKINNLEERFSKPAESAEDIRTFAVDKLNLMNLICKDKRTNTESKMSNSNDPAYQNFPQEQENARRYERLKILDQVNNSNFCEFGRL